MNGGGKRVGPKVIFYQIECLLIKTYKKVVMSQGLLGRIVPTTDENRLHRLGAMLVKTGFFAELLLT